MAAMASQAALALNFPDGRCARGPSLRSASSCSMIAWPRCCSSAWRSLVRAVGEDGVVAPGGEQLALARRGAGVLVADAADDEPGGDVQGLLLRGERRVGGLGDLGVGDPAAELVVPDGLRVLDGGPGVLGDGGDRGPDRGGDRGGDGEPGAVAADRGDHRGGVVGGVHPDDDGPGGAAGAGGPDGLGGEAGRAAGRGRVPAAQPGGGGDRGGQRGADRGDERVQAADQDGLALDLRVAEPRALLLVAVDPFLRRVDVDEGQHVRAGQQRRLARRAGPAAPGRPSRAAGRCPRYRSAGATRAWTGRGPRRTATSMAPCRSRPMSSMLSAPAAMPATRQPTFRSRVHPALAAGPDVLREQSRQAGALGEGHHRDQAAVRHEIRVIERCPGPARAMRQSHLRGVLSDLVAEA